MWWLACRASRTPDLAVAAEVQTVVADVLDAAATEPIATPAGSGDARPGPGIMMENADGMPALSIAATAPLSVADGSAASHELAKDDPAPSSATGENFARAVYGPSGTYGLTRLQVRDLYIDASVIGDDVPL